MRFYCQTCNTLIPAEDVNPDGTSARCQSCGATFDLAQILKPIGIQGGVEAPPLSRTFLHSWMPLIAFICTLLLMTMLVAYMYAP